MYKALNTYKYPATIIFFVVWMLFFDSNSVVYMYKQYQILQDLSLQEQFLIKEIEDMKRQKEELFSSDEKLEKFARENYLMKKPDEDVYVVVEDEQN